MMFDSGNELFDFYRKYGQLNGFSVKRRTKNKDVHGVCTHVTFTCGRADKHYNKTVNIVKPRAHAKNECKARVRARHCHDGKWKITAVVDEHNHGLSPAHSRFFTCNREINTHVKRQLEINDIAGIKPNKSHNAQVVGTGGHENLPFLEQDTRNMISKVRRMRLGEGDANAIQSYFLKMQSKNEGFFSLIDWNDKGRLKSVFWADQRSRAACREFGNVITVDTTYLTNKYDMPFAPFVGVNHHGQSILLGCGLIASEDTETFVWLLITWLACMHGIAPRGIITDQDRATKNAIKIVFPGIRHMWCLWHILKKIPEKLGKFKEYDRITNALGDVVYDSRSIAQFEIGWRTMIQGFGLEENAWLASMYGDREIWIPINLKNFLLVGTTQRSESMNAFFDGYVNSKTTLKKFVEHYNNALRDKVEKKCRADFISFHKKLQCLTWYEMGKQIRAMYTESKFKEFQGELSGLMYVVVKSVEMVGDLYVYYVEEEVTFGEKGRKKVIYDVKYDENRLVVECSCLRFEFRGILCRHAICVLKWNNQDMIPPQYMCDRWRKDIRRCHSRGKIDYEGWLLIAEQRRYGDLCNMFTKLADLAADYEEKYLVVARLIQDTTTKLSGTTGFSLVPCSISNDPVTRRGKGRPSSGRKKRIFKRRSTGTGPAEVIGATLGLDEIHESSKL